MSNTFKQRVAIVTGAGSGLGVATARALAAEGCAIALWDVKHEGIDALARELADDDQARAFPQIVDVASAESVEHAVADVLTHFGRIEFLLNSAGIDYTLPITELTIEQWDRILGVNLRGPFLATRAVFPIMRQQNDGHLINIASTAAVRAWPNASAYCASKWGLLGFTRAIGTEGRPHNIRATAVIPGGMRTSFFDRPDLPINPDQSWRRWNRSRSLLRRPRWPGR